MRDLVGRNLSSSDSEIRAKARDWAGALKEAARLFEQDDPKGFGPIAWMLGEAGLEETTIPDSPLELFALIITTPQNLAAISKHVREEHCRVDFGEVYRNMSGWQPHTGTCEYHWTTLENPPTWAEWEARPSA